VLLAAQGRQLGEALQRFVGIAAAAAPTSLAGADLAAVVLDIAQDLRLGSPNVGGDRGGGDLGAVLEPPGGGGGARPRCSCWTSPRSCRCSAAHEVATMSAPNYALL
jgi:hypothetical protein